MADSFAPTMYELTQCAIIDESSKFAGLSNVVLGYPLVVNGVSISTVEALYQACRYPEQPPIQQYIIDEVDGIAAKRRSRQFTAQTRSDWSEVRVPIMRWCLQVKLAQHGQTFGRLIRATGDRSIVEISDVDDFWGVVPAEADRGRGASVLGRLLMELRETLILSAGDTIQVVRPCTIPNFIFLGQPIERLGGFH